VPPYQWPVNYNPEISGMKILKSPYAYPLMVTFLVVSIILQLVWLHKIYNAQEVKFRQDLDEAMGNAARKSIYASLINETYPGSKYRSYFLSPEWLNLRMAFDNSHAAGLSKRFNYNIGRDSAVVDLSMYFFYEGFKKQYKPVDKVPETAKQKVFEQFSLRFMDKQVDSLFHAFHLTGTKYRQVYDYSSNKVISTKLPDSTMQMDYRSPLYSYNLLHRNKYQLLVSSITVAVIFQMGIYLVSSILMILFTAVTFYVILRLMNSQRLYAEARVAFTSNMTHELKTPVATVALALESIIKYKISSDPEKLKEYLDISRHELQRLNLMIDKVLNLDQSEHGELPLVAELYDVQTGIDQVIATMRLQLDQNRSVIHFDLAKESRSVLRIMAPASHPFIKIRSLTVFSGFPINRTYIMSKERGSACST
jgi:hypothetical protein